VAATPQSRPSVGHRILWYVPNRLADLFDILRLRVHAGPQLGLNLRATKYANVFAGRYHTAWVGLPGPRQGKKIVLPWGLEQDRGLLVMGIDATDDLPDPPRFSPSEFDAGLYVLIVGADAGFDPVELGDFLAGLLMFDPKNDDH
jgi:hypothetical protein